MKENQAFSEMMVHTPLCTHKEAQNVLIIGSSNDSLKMKLLNIVEILSLEILQF